MQKIKGEKITIDNEILVFRLFIKRHWCVIRKKYVILRPEKMMDLVRQELLRMFPFTNCVLTGCRHAGASAIVL